MLAASLVLDGASFTWALEKNYLYFGYLAPDGGKPIFLKTRK
jgi:hypothetical protein